MKRSFYVVLTLLGITICAFARVAQQRPELIVQTGHTRPVSSVVFSPNGKLVASSGWDNTIKLWDVASGRELRTILPRGPIDCLSFNPDGQILAGIWSDEIELWDVATGRELRRLIGQTDGITSIAFSPDGKILASAGALNEGMDHSPTIKLWDVRTGKDIRTITGHNGGIYSVSFSPNGKILASGARNGAVKLWDLSNGHALRSIIDNPKTTNAIGQVSVAFGVDGRMLFTGSESDHTSGEWQSRIRIWDVETGRELHNVIFSDGGSTENDFAISPNGRLVAVPSGKNIELVDVNSGNKLLKLIGHQENVISVAFSPDSNMLVSGSGDNEVKDTTVRLWEVRSGRQLFALTGDNYKFSDVIADLAGSTLASTDSFIIRGNDQGSTKALKLWDLIGERGLTTLVGHDRLINATSFSPDGKILASGAEASPNGAGLIKLWDVESGTLICDLRGSNSDVFSLAFDARGEVLASGGDKTITLWDVATQRELRTISAHDRQVDNLVFSPDNKVVASGSRDDKVKLWNVIDGREIRVIDCDSRVTDIAFSYDGSMLAVEKN